MTREKVKVAFITQMVKRKAAYKKRKSGLMKKLKEVTTLCGVDACAIIPPTEFNPEPEYWPNRLEAERVVAVFKSLPHAEQTRKMTNLISYAQNRIAKTNIQLHKQVCENRQKELTQVMLDCLTGRVRLDKCKVDDLEDLGKVIDNKILEIERRIASLKVHDASQAGPSNIAEEHRRVPVELMLFR